MPTRSNIQNDQLMKLTREVSELKELLNDHRDSQLQINAEVMSHVEVAKMWQHRVAKMFLCFRKLQEKYKEQRIEVNVLNKLLRGKLNSSCVCECGRRVDLMNNRVEKISTDMKKIEEIDCQTVEMKRKNSSKFTQTDPEIIGTAGDVTAMNPLKGAEASSSKCGDEMRSSVFLYSKELQKLWGSIIKEYPRVGPLKNLNEEGKWRLEASDSMIGVDELWRKIAAGQGGVILSKSLILPAHWSGLVVWMGLFGRRNNREFGIQFFAPELKLNGGVDLPQILKLKILIEGEFESEIQQFKVEELSSLSSHFGFISIPIGKLSKREFPNIDVQFFE